MEKKYIVTLSPGGDGYIVAECPTLPADEIISATSLVHRVPLLTRDRKMRRSKLVPTAA